MRISIGGPDLKEVNLDDEILDIFKEEKKTDAFRLQL